MNDETEEFEIRIDEKGNLIISPYEYLKSLSDERKKELLNDGGWWCLVETEIVKSIINSFGTESYNEDYHRFRTLLLNSAAMPEVIRMWAKNMIELRTTSKRHEEYWEQAYRDIHKWAMALWDKFEGNKGMWVDAGFPKLPERKWQVEYPKELIEEAYAKAREWGVLFPDPDPEMEDDVEEVVRGY